MTNRQIQICPACNRATEIVWVHSHGQCSFCKTNIDACCSGETADDENKNDTKKTQAMNFLIKKSGVQLECCYSHQYS